MLLPYLMNLDMFGPPVPPTPVGPVAALGGGPVQFPQITDLKRQPVWGANLDRLLERDVAKELRLQAKHEDDDIIALVTAFYAN